MAQNKKVVLLYCDLIHTVEKLDNETAGELFKHYLRYVNDLNPTTKSQIVDVVFEPIKQNLKRDLCKWEKTLEGRSKAGKISAEKRRIKKELQQNSTNSTNVKSVQQTSTNPTVTVTVNDTVKVKDNNISIRDTEFKNSLQPFLKTYGKDILNDFYLYWTEKKPRGKKMRFELQSTFDVGRRLLRWSKNNFNKNNNEKSKSINELANNIRRNNPNL